MAKASKKSLGKRVTFQEKSLEKRVNSRPRNIINHKESNV